MRLPALLLASLLPVAALADAPWGKADPKAGKTLHDKACVACHARIHGGDGSGIYTRKQRLVGNQSELLQRVAVCSSAAKTGWRPEEEASVAAWLNQQYYHFEQ